MVSRHSCRPVSKAGYTLIEMLITITIFSGLLVIVLGSFASSSSSSAKVNTLRQKNEAVRRLIDQIANDFRFVNPQVSLKDFDGTEYKGFLVEPERLVMALQLPNANAQTGLVRKEYTIEQYSGRLSLTLKEGRNCAVADFLQNCLTNSSKTDLLSSAYALNQESPTFPSEFGGLDVLSAQSSTPAVAPFLSLALTIKPADAQSLRCSELDPGNCYKVETSLNLGAAL